jgi:hypothetical protein
VGARQIIGGPGRRWCALALASALCAFAALDAVPGGAAAAAGRGRASAAVAPRERLQMHAGLTPERLGGASTVAVGYALADPAGEVPQPVTQMQLMLPAGLSVSDTELGLANCRQARLELEGARGCPGDSRIGHGAAVAEVPFGSQRVDEHVSITLYSAPLLDQEPQLLVYVAGEHPVIANIVFAASVRPASAPFGSLIDTAMPLVPGIAGGPGVALLSMRTTIGPAGIIYTERVHGRMVRFHPKGLILPSRCPRGGFPFAVALSFENGTSSVAQTRVRCPRRR